jgi:hypothetical protein
LQERLVFSEKKKKRVNSGTGIVGDIFFLFGIHDDANSTPHREFKP